MAVRSFAKLNFNENLLDGYQPGDAAAHRAAAALADKADQPTIAALSGLLDTLERIGGQAYVTTFRAREEGQQDFETIGFKIDFEPRDARVEFMKPPDAIEGTPVTEAGAAPVQIAPERPAVEELPEPDKPEPDPADEPEPIAAEA